MELNSVIMDNVGQFRSAVTVIDKTVSGNDMLMHVYTETYGDVSRMKLETENGVTATVDIAAKTGDGVLDAFVYARDFCVACNRMATEKTVTLIEDDRHLYICAFYNQHVGGYELECGLVKQDAFDQGCEFDPDESLVVDQMTMLTVTDSIYEYDSVEILRKNGVVSFRVGDGNVTLATVMNTEHELDDAPRDLAIRVSADIFKTIPALQDENCRMSIDTKHNMISVESGFVTICGKYAGCVLESLTSVGLDDYCTMDSAAIATTIDVIFKVNYTDDAGIAVMSRCEDDLMHLSVSNERIDINLTVGEVTMHSDLELRIPINVLTMMIRNTQCKNLTMKASSDGKRVMLCYSNKLFSRKCTYIAE